MEKKTEKLSKSSKNRVLFGVCGGIGEYFNIDPNIVRLIFIVVAFFGGIGVIAYIVSALLMPEQSKEIKNMEEKPPDKTGSNILILGIILIIIGVFYFFREAELFFLPHWIDIWIWRITHLFNFWGILLIILGLVIVFRYYNYKPEEKKEKRELVRLKEDKKIGGVCRGLGFYLGIDVTIVRVVFILFAIFVSWKIAIITYMVLLIIMPEKKQSLIEETENEKKK